MAAAATRGGGRGGGSAPAGAGRGRGAGLFLLSVVCFILCRKEDRNAVRSHVAIDF